MEPTSSSCSTRACATRSASEADADDALEAIGWSDVLAAEPRDAVSVVFGALGDLNAVASALDDVVLDALGLDLGARRARSRSRRSAAGSLPATLRDGGLEIDGLAFARVARRDTVAVPARDGERTVVAMVPTEAIERTAVDGLAPELGLSRLRADAAQPVTIETLAPTAWDDALIAGRRALATELVAAGRVMLRLAREHALERVQFGRPIAQFQAVRHRLAETYVALEAADAAVVSAWDAPDPLTAMLAKSLAGRGATRRGHALPAGAGRHRVHRRARAAPLRRSARWCSTACSGRRRRLPQEIGSTILATRQLPRLLDL